MKLILMRHAKSAWPDHVADFDRPLNERGMRDAPRMFQHMAEKGLLPQLALVSPAQRTRETFEFAAPVFGAVQHIFVPEIYEASAEQLLRVICQFGGQADTLLVVGHNPAMEILANGLTSAVSRQAFPLLSAAGMPTAAFAVLKADFSRWADLAPKSCELEYFTAPKLLAAA